MCQARFTYSRQKKEGVKPSFKLIKKFYSLYLNPALNIEP